MESSSENITQEVNQSFDNLVQTIDQTFNNLIEKIDQKYDNLAEKSVSHISQIELINEPPVEVVLENSKIQSVLEDVLENDVVFDYDNDKNDNNENKNNEDAEETNYKYTNIDTLDEDDVIPGQQYVLMSFISPERIMNCDIRGVKIRGVYSSREKAEKALETLKKKDKYFDIWLGEVGKWLPWNPNTSQVEEVKYRNKKLDKIMGKVHKTELETLNELVGRRKEQLDKDKGAHKDRIKNSIKDAVRNYEKNEEEPLTSTSEAKPIKSTNSAKPSRQNNAEAIKQRLRKTLEKRAEAKALISNDNATDTQKAEELKVTSDEIKGKLDKMKEYMKNRSK